MALYGSSFGSPVWELLNFEGLTCTATTLVFPSSGIIGREVTWQPRGWHGKGKLACQCPVPWHALACHGTLSPSNGMPKLGHWHAMARQCQAMARQCAAMACQRAAMACQRSATEKWHAKSKQWHANAVQPRNGMPNPSNGMPTLCNREMACQRGAMARQS